GEMVESDAGLEPALVARGEDAPVVIERRDRELTLLRLDPRPLDRKAVQAEAEVRDDLQVVAIAVVVIARVPGRLGEERSGRVLEEPVVAPVVAALDLVRGHRRAPEKALRKLELRHRRDLGRS